MYRRYGFKGFRGSLKTRANSEEVSRRKLGEGGESGREGDR